MTRHKQQLDRHDVGEVILEVAKPMAFDPVSLIEGTGRFVIVANYEIAGGGIILEEVRDSSTLLQDHIREREIAWDKGYITPDDRGRRYGHASKFIVFAGEEYAAVTVLAKELERRLFSDHHHAYYLGPDNMLSGLGSDMEVKSPQSADSIKSLGELARILTDSGQIFITALSGIDDYDLEMLKVLNTPAEILVVCLGPNVFTRYGVDLVLPADIAVDGAITQIYKLLREKEVIVEYYI